MTGQVLCRLRLTCAKRSLWRTSIAVLKGDEERTLASLSEWRDNEPLLAAEILIAELLVVLQHLEANLRLLRLELGSDFFVKRVDSRCASHGHVLEDAFSSLKIKLHAQLPAEVRLLVDTFALDL